MPNTQGLYFDPATYEPTTGGAGMVRSLEVFESLMQWNSPSATAQCGGAGEEFAAGR
jgi:hypothetical protein